MTPANVVLNGCDLDNAIDAAIEQQANAELRGDGQAQLDRRPA